MFSHVSNYALQESLADVLSACYLQAPALQRQPTAAFEGSLAKVAVLGEPA